ncbi:MAG: hypothetical protein ACYDIA_15285 [Candidatus Humimicrobiaceae bacterium]
MFREKKKNIFVITKCGEPYSYNNEIIRKIAGKINIKCTIAELKFSFEEKSLLEDIYIDISNADYVLIDLLPTNFNISYEAGLAYTLNKLKPKKANFYFLTPKYLFDLDKIPTDIKGLRHLPYSNYKEYALIIKSCLENEIKDESTKKELDDFINSLNIPNSETFLDYNVLSEKFVFNDSRINLTSEGMQISYAHFPIYYKNFEFFNDYELTINARIDLRRLGIALHVETDANKNISLLKIPLPLKLFMLNISQDGEILPHVLDRNILNKTYHYWPFYGSKYNFKTTKLNDFFKLVVQVKRNMITIILNDIESHLIDIAKLDIGELNYTDCMDSSFSNNEILFKDRMKELLDGLKQGSFGFRVHPDEMATIKSLKYVFH